MKARSLAASAHLGLSMIVAAGVLALVYLAWYPGPLDSISGVGDILLLLLGVDVALGPVLTFAVYDTRKRSLALDLAVIALLQVGALVYGVYTIEAGRPHHLVFVKDRFEVVSRADLHPGDRAAAAGNPAAKSSWFGPRLVAAEMPASPEENRALMLEATLGGRDAQHFPKQYRDYASQAADAVRRSKPLFALRDLNPNGEPELQAAIAKSDVPEERLKWLPVKGPSGDATMLIDGSTGATVGMVLLSPWPR